MFLHYASFRCSSSSDQMSSKPAVCAICNGIGDRAAEHVKLIVFGVLDLQDTQCSRDVNGDQLQIAGGLRFLNAFRDHRGRIHSGYASYAVMLVGRVYSMSFQPCVLARLVST